MSNKPNHYIRWLDRIADTESQASNAVLWTLIIISLIAGAVAVAIFKEPAPAGKIVCMVLIGAGIVGLKLFSKS